MTSTATTPDPEVVDLADASVSGLLEQAAECEAVLREAAVHQLRIAYEWAIAHPVVDAAETARGPVLPSVLEAPETLGGPGTPAVAAFTAEPLAVACGIAPSSATALLADALDLHHRLPVLWQQTQAGLVAVWKARRVAARTRDLSLDAALWVDRHTAGRVGSLSLVALDRLVAEAAARVDGESLGEKEKSGRSQWDVKLKHRDPRHGGATSEIHAVGDTLDLTRFHDIVCAEAETLGALGDDDAFEVRKAKALGVIADAQARLDLTSLLSLPGAASDRDCADVDADQVTQVRRRLIERRDAKVRLYLHASLADITADTSGSVGTVERLGPVTLDQIKAWVGKARVTIQPVLHVASDDTWSVDRHDPPSRMAEQVVLRDSSCVFPWCSHPSRHADLDHVDPYEDPDEGGPPGQTTPSNLAPLCRRHHRAKTAGAWTYQRTAPGTYLWTGPAGITAIVTPTGTLTLGSSS
ncbi:HNH endonuclease [Nocardioides seonyuensis]|uniref:HNH endonuclease n=1 Tax=Nocardioides seonyuensis TaxID=2518371 RepID=A0A4P7IG86_9ACTN|nr:HNH endonuclease signature motif containing protein [Nocardioides seonyuensis]QBX56334.1 HNH endonuclease [Nocardioides seonyuensis]